MKSNYPWYLGREVASTNWVWLCIEVVTGLRLINLPRLGCLSKGIDHIGAQVLSGVLGLQGNKNFPQEKWRSSTIILGP